MHNNVIIMGSRGYTKNYGGWETLVHGMLDNWKDSNTSFYVIEVAESADEENHVLHNNVHCIRIFPDDTGKMQMLKMEVSALKELPNIIKEFNIDNPLIYVLGMRVSLVFLLNKRKLKSLGAAIVVNSDGVGWKRGKYSLAQKIYSNLNAWISHNFVMDYLVADAQEMKRIILSRQLPWRKKIPTKVIYYGTNEVPILPPVMPDKVKKFFNDHGIIDDKYYLIINRLVPENSYELILKQFIDSKTDCDFIVVTNQEKEKEFFKKLRVTIPFEQDKRVKFVGTIYDKDILTWLRQKARGYINGHTLGGTNPGLLEALASTNVNLIRDCPFSREGAADLGFYFDEKHPLSEVIARVDAMPFEERKELGDKAKERMRTFFSWDYVDSQYVELFNEINSKRGNIK